MGNPSAAADSVSKAIGTDSGSSALNTGINNNVVAPITAGVKNAGAELANLDPTGGGFVKDPAASTQIAVDKISTGATNIADKILPQTLIKNAGAELANLDPTDPNSNLNKTFQQWGRGVDGWFNSLSSKLGTAGGGGSSSSNGANGSNNNPALTPPASTPTPSYQSFMAPGGSTVLGGGSIGGGGQIGAAPTLLSKANSLYGTI